MARPEITGRKVLADSPAAFRHRGVLPGAPDLAVHVFQNEELGPWPARDGGRLAPTDLAGSRRRMAQVTRSRRLKMRRALPLQEPGSVSPPVGERKEFTDEILQKRTRENNA